ncbi:unnamed protein product [Haemonchus placei]|uniref:Uncharacterized protein n=1 Tax=Haemonchus placei TaxID=6290 RepID=A0A3P7XDJ7_HAEPC|nr:unnamed protein product [Haemonchus placei]
MPRDSSKAEYASARRTLPGICWRARRYTDLAASDPRCLRIQRPY